MALLFLLFACRAQAAIVRVHSDGVASGGVFSLTIASNVLNTTAANLLVVGTRQSGNVDVPIITNVAGDTWNEVGCKDITTHGDGLTCLFYAMNINHSAVDVITATWADPQQFRVIFTIEYSGLKTSGALDAAPAPVDSGGLGVLTLATGAFSTVQASEVLVGMVGTASLIATYTAGPESGGYSIVQSSSQNDAAIEDNIVAVIQVGVTASISWNDSATASFIVASFKAAGGGGGGPGPRHRVTQE